MLHYSLPAFIAAAVAAAVIVSAVSASAARYLTLRSARVETMLDAAYDEGYDDGGDALYSAAARHVRRLEQDELERKSAPDVWLHEQLADLYAWSERERAKSARQFWRIRNAPVPELDAPRQLALEIAH